MAKSRSLRDIAISVLTGSLTPLLPERIAARAITTGLLPPGALFIEVAVGDILDADVDRKGDRSAFVRASPGHYGLNPRRPYGSEDAGPDLHMPATRRLMDAAAAVLRGSLGPLPLNMLTRRIMDELGVRPSLHMLYAVLEESMEAEMAARGPQSRLTRLPTGHYALRSHPAYDLGPAMSIDPKTPLARLVDYPYPRTTYKSGTSSALEAHDLESDLTRMESAVTDPPAQSTTKPSRPKPRARLKGGRRPPSAYAGKGSEHLVASKLLFLQHGVSVPLVDTGADLITTADDLTHAHIQVKSALITNNACRFGLKNTTFTKDAKKNMFYVFVLRHDHAMLALPDFLIFPHAALSEYLRQEHIQQRTKTISIKFFQDGERILMGPKNLDVSAFHNNWEQLNAASGRRE